MKLPNEKSAAAAREAKRRLENPLTEAQKAEKVAVEAERLRKIKRTADKNSERLRAKAERRSAAGVEGLAAEATRKSARGKTNPLTDEQKAKRAMTYAFRNRQFRLTVEQKAEKVRIETERRNAVVRLLD